MATDFLHGVEVVTVAGGPRPIQTIRSAIIGIVGTAPGADDAAFPLDTPVLINSRGGIGTIGTTGTLPGALNSIFTEFSPFVVVIRVDEGADADATLANVVGAVDAGTGARTGIQALKDAQAIVGVTPMLLIAPGFTSLREVDPLDNTKHLKNAAAAALESVATALRAHAIIGGPNTTDADALDYVKDFGTRRTFIVDPFGMVYDSVAEGYVAKDPAAAVAGLIARVDAEQGFWKSPSNEELLSIGGIARPVDFALGDPNTRANLLNENNVATIIRDEGFRLWGNRTTSADAQFAFLCVSRTADMIDLSIQRAHRWACDKGITRGYFDDVTSSVNAYLRDLEARGAIVGGKCWVDPDFNNAQQIAAGHATFSYEFTPTYPAERVTFRSSITDAFITNLFPAS
jgi:hypothetical protein